MEDFGKDAKLKGACEDHPLMTPPGPRDSHSTTEGLADTAPVDSFPICHRRCVLLLLILTRIAAQYDGGAIAAVYGDKSEEGLVEDFNLSKSEQGLLVTLGYVGLIIGCVLSGTLLQYFSAKTLLQLSLVIVAAGVGGVAASPNYEVLAGMRPIVGFGQALITVLYPVWVDEHSPPGCASGWMAGIQAAGPLGIVVGYLTSGFLMANANLSWRWCFIIQGCLLVPCIIVYLFLPAKYTELRLRKGADEVHFGTGAKEVLGNGVVWTATLTLSSLYFVVNGLQMWVTDYLTDDSSPIQASYNTVVAAFGATAATAPVAGIISGGILLNKAGGYRGHIDRASLIGVGLGACAAGFAYSMLVVTSFPAFIALVWLLLFFGGSMVPGLTGIIVAAVPREYRGLVSSFAAFMYNSLGYALGPLVCGIVADEFGLVWGFRVVMGWAGGALLLQITVWLIARRRVAVVEGELLTPRVDGEGDVEHPPPQNTVRKAATYGTIPCVSRDLQLAVKYGVEEEDVMCFNAGAAVSLPKNGRSTITELFSSRRARQTWTEGGIFDGLRHSHGWETSTMASDAHSARLNTILSSSRKSSMHADPRWNSNMSATFGSTRRLGMGEGSPLGATTVSNGTATNLTSAFAELGESHNGAPDGGGRKGVERNE